MDLIVNHFALSLYRTSWYRLARLLTLPIATLGASYLDLALALKIAIAVMGHCIVWFLPEVINNLSKKNFVLAEIKDNQLILRLEKVRHFDLSQVQQILIRHSFWPVTKSKILFVCSHNKEAILTSVDFKGLFTYLEQVKAITAPPSGDGQVE